MKWYKSFSEQMRYCIKSGNSFVIEKNPCSSNSVIVCVPFKTYCHSKACLDKRCAEEYKRMIKEN